VRIELKLETRNDRPLKLITKTTRRNMNAIRATFPLVAVSLTAHAGLKQWNGGDDAWTNPNAWTPAGVPTTKAWAESFLQNYLGNRGRETRCKLWFGSYPGWAARAARCWRRWTMSRHHSSWWQRRETRSFRQRQDVDRAMAPLRARPHKGIDHGFWRNGSNRRIHLA
jgi:hypothetical protein